MKSVHYALAAAALLGLAGCGESEDASADAMADNVEVPADEAMTDTPMPVEDSAVVEDTADAEPTTDAVEQSAQEAADDAQSAVDDAVSAAEDSMD